MGKSLSNVTYLDMTFVSLGKFTLKYVLLDLQSNFSRCYGERIHLLVKGKHNGSIIQVARNRNGFSVSDAHAYI